MILADLGHPSAAELAHAMRVSLSTAKRWVRAGHAPHAVMLALFWLTRWGRSQVECQAVNDARLMAELARSRELELQAARAEVARLLTLGDFGSANAPTMEAVSCRLPLHRRA